MSAMRSSSLDARRLWSRKNTYRAAIGVVQKHSGAYGMGVDYAYTLVHKFPERVKHSERIAPAK